MITRFKPEELIKLVALRIEGKPYKELEKIFSRRASTLSGKLTKTLIAFGFPRKMKKEEKQKALPELKKMLEEDLLKDNNRKSSVKRDSKIEKSTNILSRSGELYDTQRAYDLGMTKDFLYERESFMYAYIRIILSQLYKAKISRDMHFR